MTPFAHLHVHTHYSMFDGIGMPEQYVKKAKEQGSPAIAITEHGGMYSAIEFYKVSQEYGIRPVIGCEAYLAFNGRADKRPNIDSQRYHMLLWAENHLGYENLLKLITFANLEGMYYKPRIDWELLEKYHHGLIVTSGCLQGEIPQAILAGNHENTMQLIRKYQKVFGMENFFLELQDHPHLADQVRLNEALADLAQKYKIPLVATNDAHYVNKDDDDAEDAMLCIQMNVSLDDPGRLSMKGTDFSLRPPAEMMKVFEHAPEAIENTVKIAERCSYNFEFGKYLIPSFQLPKETTPASRLRELAYDGLIRKFQIPNHKFQKNSNDQNSKFQTSDSEIQKLFDRLEYELGVIEQMGFSNYFLIVWDFVKWAKDHDIVVGPGRGSAAGSLVSYALDITTIDPIRYGLLFERFLNPERISMPDIDLDFADNRRDEVLTYVRQKYGEDKVAQISTFGTMSAKAVVKDVGRVMGIPFVEMNDFTKLITERPGTRLSDEIERNSELRQAIEANPKFQKIMKVALKLEGSVRHISVHACAVVIADKPLTAYTALQHPPKEDASIITQYSAKPLEALGLLKMDFLGLKNLTILQTTLKIIERTKGKKIELSGIPLDDKKTYALMARGETTGVFQLESAGMKRYLKELRPTEFEDIIAMVSLFRPGPMEWIPDYIDGKHKRKKVQYLHPSLEPILEGTHGIAIYQEQILQIAQAFGGFTLGEADLLRRAIGKKIAHELEAQRDKFIQGAVAKGYDRRLAVMIFEKVIEPFAGYGFNKSHGASYAMIAYLTAYLKAHYPTEFMTALMSSDEGDMDRVVLEIGEAEEMGIEVLPPDVNESLAHFTVVKDGTIRFGLSAIKGVGEGSVKSIIEARSPEATGSGKFKSLEDFAKQVPQKVLNKKSIESLALSGAMDCLGERTQIAANYEKITEYSKAFQSSHQIGQQDLFGALGAQATQAIDRLELNHTEPAPQSQKLQWEKDFLGLYVSSHPLAGLGKYFRKKVVPLDAIVEKAVGQSIKVGGLAIMLRKVTTKKGDAMAILTLEDSFGKIDAVAFPAVYQKFVSLWSPDGVFFIDGKLEKRMGVFQITIDSVRKMSVEDLQAEAQREKLWTKNEKITRATRAVKEEEEAREAAEVFKGEEEEGGPEGITPSSRLRSPEATSGGPLPLRNGDILYPQVHQFAIPAEASKAFFVELRELLQKYPGEESVELLIGDRVMNLPMTIKMAPQLQEEMDGLIERG